MRMIERRSVIRGDGVTTDDPVKFHEIANGTEAWVAGGKIVQEFYENHFFALKEDPEIVAAGATGFARMTLEHSFVIGGENVRAREVWEICAEVPK